MRPLESLVPTTQAAACQNVDVQGARFMPTLRELRLQQAVWLNADPRLPQEVVQRVHAPAIKSSLGRLRVDLPEVERQVPLQGFRWLPIRNAHLLTVVAATPPSWASGWLTLGGGIKLQLGVRHLWSV